MKRAEASAVHDVLVRHCGVTEDDYSREDFIHAHRDGNEFPCREYRFIGALGFGGKFWSKEMRVSCYPEDETPERRASIEAANAELKALSP